MISRAHSHHILLHESFSKGAGVFVFLIGGIALGGWMFGVPVLSSFSSDLIPMAPSTALLFISFGIAILFRAQFPKTSWLYKAGIIFCSLGTLISLLLFFVSSFGIHPAIEHLGFKIEGAIAGMPLGNISPLTASCFVLAGVSFLLSYVSSEQRKLMLAAFSCAFLLILVSIVLLLAHLFGTPLLYGTQFIPPALSTSLALFFLGIALIALTSPNIERYKSEIEAASIRSSIILIMVFVILAAGIISAGYFYYKTNEKEFRLEKERELSSIADLKTSELTHIRKDWVEDASLFYENTFFSSLVYRYFNNPKDSEAYRQLQSWLNHFEIANKYNKLSLFDAAGVERFALPDSPEPRSATYRDKISEAIKFGAVTIVDFYRNEYDQHIYLNILVPIPDPKNNKRINGILSLRIDPEEYLYPYIKSWPIQSKTAETILVRREGDDALFLNEVKLKQHTALSLRISLHKKYFPAVKAVQGEEGIVEGYDYRDVPVLADIHHVPDSPWFIITKIDMAEVYEPLSEKLWMMIFLITALLFGAGTSVAVVWRHQRVRFFQERFQSAETLRESHELLEKVFSNTHIMIAYLDAECNFIRVNQAYAEADGRTPDFYPGKNHFALFPHAENEILFHKVVETGQSLTVFAKPFEYAEHPERGISFWDWSLQPVKASDDSVTALVLSTINVTERLQAEGRIQKLNRVYALLSNINQAIVRLHDTDQLLHEICRVAIEDGKFRMVWIGMINRRTNVVDVAASAGLTEDYLSKIKIDLNDKKQFEGPTLKALRSGHFTISNDIAADENMTPWREQALKLGYRSSASFPIKVLGTIRGVIKLYSGEVEFFTKDEIELLDEMAMDVSFALEFIEHEAKRKVAEEFLLKFRMGIERSGDAVLLTDPDGTIVYVNPAFENTFGYSKEEAIGKTPRILKSGVLSQEYYKNFWDTLITKKAITHEIINKTKDGRLLSVEASVNPMINEQGEIIGYLAIERDTTERRRAEKALREYAEQYRTMVSATLFGFWLVDEKGKLLDVNDTYCRMSGYSKKELLHLSIFDLEFAENHEDTDRHMQKVIKTGTDQFESKHKAKDGRVFDVEISTGFLYSPKQFIAFIRDITERKRAEVLQNAVYQISQTADKIVTLDELYKSVHEIISTIMPAKNFYISLYDEKQNLLRFPYFVDEIDVPQPVTKLGKGLTEYVLRTSAPLLCDEGTDKKLREEGEVELVGEPSAIWLGVPLIVGDKTIGVMAVQHYSDPKAYGEKELQILEYVSSQVARAIERKRIEEALRQAHDHLREAQRVAHFGSWEADLVTGKLKWSDEMYHIYGVARESFVHTHDAWLELIYPEDRHVVQSPLETTDGNKEHIENLQFRIVRPDGSIRFVESTTKAYFDLNGKAFHMIGVTHDITERRWAEEALKTSEEKYRLLSETAEDIITVYNSSGEISYLNTIGQKYFELTENNYQGRNIFEFVSKKYHELLKNNFKERLSGFLGSRLFEIELINKQGTSIPAEIRSTPIVVGGNITGFISVARDITGRKFAEEKEKSLQSQLIQAQKLESLGTLAGGVAHDFNNILGIILAHSSILNRVASEPAKLSRSVDAIDQAVKRGAGLVKQLLTVARKSDVLFERINVNDSIKEISNMLRETFPKTIEYAEQLDPQLPFIKADRNQLYQVLLNLCVNARDAMPEGGTLTIKTGTISGDEVHNKFPGAEREHYVWMSIADSGVGIDPETKARMFDPFFTTKELGKGTGLGLSLVDGIVRANHGFIAVESEVGHGTTFTIYLPAPQSPMEVTPKQTLRKEEVIGGTETILLIEDEEMLRELLKAVLVSQGYRVLTAADGEEGVSVFSRHQKEVAVVITDMGLPKLSGREVFRNIRTINPKAKVIMASGFIEQNDKSEMLKAGVKLFVQKPYFPDEILRTLRSVIDLTNE
ncbi:MAG: PAS domain S-box protein [Bacteroidota bacterium]|nr:PAS domain S-box protein [Bacteroidota bacterium]